MSSESGWSKFAWCRSSRGIATGDAAPSTFAITATGAIGGVVSDRVLERTVAVVTVRFEADIAAVTRNKDGEVVAGSLSDAVQTRDLWTFRRDIAANDPNWLLIETDEEE